MHRSCVHRQLLLQLRRSRCRCLRQARELLVVTLSQPVNDLDNVSAHLQQLKALLGKGALLPLLEEVMARISSNPAPPAPRYDAASVIQPELR